MSMGSREIERNSVPRVPIHYLSTVRSCIAHGMRWESHPPLFIRISSRFVSVVVLDPKRWLSYGVSYVCVCSEEERAQEGGVGAPARGVGALQ